MRVLFVLLLLGIWMPGNAQDDPKFNLGFEGTQEGEALPAGWIAWGDYALGVDTVTTYAGKHAAKITSGENGGSFGSIAYRIPANYVGKTIRLEGYMKTEDVSDGFAGLLLRIDGEGGSLAFDNMQNEAVQGTNDWKQYSITLDFPVEARTIFVAGILVGRGTAWFDAFELTIDGEDVQTLAEVERELAPAALDTEFDGGSGIEFPELTPALTDDLELLGRVWGFLKYHHPEIAVGNLNWDYELFRFLPTYLAANDAAARDARLISWIDSLGPAEGCTDCEAVAPDAHLKPQLGWIADQEQALRNALERVYANRYQQTHYYVGMNMGASNPQFRNEAAYMDMPYPDPGFRLLSLYRYWNMIQYFFPYRDLTDKDWDEVLGEYLPKFISAEDELAYELAAKQLIGEVKDTHANLWGGGDKIDSSRGNYYPPVHVRFIEDRLVVTDAYDTTLMEKAGLQIGDVITTIAGEPIDVLIERNAIYYPASNRPTMLRDLSHGLLRSTEDEVAITYERGEEPPVSTSLKLYPSGSIDNYRWYRRNYPPSFRMLDGNIGYITLQSIKDKDIPTIKDTFANTAGIVIDIRNYPSTFVPFKLGSYFVSEPTPFVKFTNGSTANPGEFTFTQPLEIAPGPRTYAGKVVVIVNELSQSQAEYTAMAFRAGDNTTIIGSTTAGADGNVSRIALPGGLQTMISGIGVFYPDGGETQRVGIVPDIEVKPTIAGIRAGRDELLERAIELILND